MRWSERLRRVFFLTNLPVPYRIDFFNELGKFCTLRVYFERTNAATRDRAWLSTRARSFEPVFLPGIPVHEDSALCPSIVTRLRQGDFDTIIVGSPLTPTGMLAIEYLRARRVRFFLNSDGGYVKNDNPVLAAVKRRYIGSAEWGLASGQGAARYLRHYGAGIKEIYTYPFTSVWDRDIAKAPVPMERKRGLREQLGIPGSRMALCVGRYLPVKGFEVAIAAWRGMPDETHLVLVGNGPLEAMYRDRVRSYDLRNVHILGFKQKEELRQFYDAADALLFPTRGDVWGLVVNEALSRGLPVVTTTRCGAAPDLLAGGENGTIVPVDDADALRTATAELLEDEAKRSRMASSALAKSREYTIERMASRHMEIFNAVS